MAPPHIAWLTNTYKTIRTADGLTAELWKLNPQQDPVILSAWAKHFRDHYCDDALLDRLRQGTGKSRGQFLNEMKFPDAVAKPGPSVRAGDFAEILIADYIEHHLGYWCPRELRYDMKWNRNESTKGCDVVGFKFVDANDANVNDELFIFEAKAKLGAASATNRLQDAVDDSAKDLLREGMTLSALKQRCWEKGDEEAADRVERFQNMVDRPFVRISGAAAILSQSAFDEASLATTTTRDHPNQPRLKLIVVRGETLMELVHALYKRAADEA